MIIDPQEIYLRKLMSKRCGREVKELDTDPKDMFTLVEAQRVVSEELGKDEPDYERYAEASLWLEQNAKGEVEVHPPRAVVLYLLPWVLLIWGIALAVIGAATDTPAFLFLGAFVFGLPAMIRPWER